jgi:hypothetical protein
LPKNANGLKTLSLVIEVILVVVGLAIIIIVRFVLLGTACRASE